MTSNKGNRSLRARTAASARQPDHRGNRLRPACRRRLHRLCAKARLLCAGAACRAGFRAAGAICTAFAADFRL